MLQKRIRENLACSRPPGGFTPPPRENPGSATACCKKEFAMTPILQILSVCEKPRMVQEEVLTYDLMKTFLYVRLYNTRMHSSRMRTTRSSGSVCLSACWVIPPRGVGLETPSGQTPQLPPWVWAWRPARHAGIPPSPPPRDLLQSMLGYHLQCILGYLHPL